MLAAAALAVAGAAGARIEPFLGGRVVLLAAGVLVARHPARAAVLRGRGRIDRRLGALGLLAAAPALLSAWTAGLSTLAVGGASVLLPSVAGSLGSVGGLAAVAWGAGLLAVSRCRDSATADTTHD